MIVLFDENVLLLSTYKFIAIPVKYRNFEALPKNLCKTQSHCLLNNERMKLIG